MSKQTLSKSTEAHMTKKHDAKFKQAKSQGLNWYPWVGKNYHKTKILILGLSTHRDETGDETSEDWTDNYGHNASRTFFSFDNNECYGYKPFYTTSKLFLKGAGINELNLATHSAFWESVAFNNYYQIAVRTSGATPENDDDIEKAKSAFAATVEIIKPELVVVWGVSLVDRMGLPNVKNRKKKVGSTYPRVAAKEGEFPCIIGTKHPSWAFPRSQWLNFLRTESHSKIQVKNFITYLKITVSC